MGLTQNSKMWALPYVNREVILILSLNIGKKIPVHKKIKDANPSIKSTRQMRALVDTTQRKNERKQSKKKKKGEKPYC